MLWKIGVALGVLAGLFTGGVLLRDHMHCQALRQDFVSAITDINHAGVIGTVAADQRLISATQRMQKASERQSRLAIEQLARECGSGDAQQAIQDAGVSIGAFNRP